MINDRTKEFEKLFNPVKNGLRPKSWTGFRDFQDLQD